MNANLRMCETLDQLSNPVLQQLANVFDKTGKPNWRTIISVLPERFYSSQKIEQFGMAILKPGGSPTMALLKDLMQRKRPKSDLIAWLHCLNQKGFNTAQAISILEQRALTPEHRALRSQVTPFQSSSSNTIIVSSHPVSGRGIIDSMFELKCDAYGDGQLHYQWFHFNTPVGTDTNLLYIGPLDKNHSGFYICRISNSTNYCFTNWACLEVCRLDVENGSRPPLITVHPRSMNCFNGESLLLFCDAAGKPAPEFQWFHNDEKICKANSRELNITSAKISDSGLYHCTASNVYATVSSLSAVVDVIDRSKQPFDTEYFRGRESVSDQCDAGLEHRGRPVSKVALLIGNQNYEHSKDLGMLVHPGNDARDIGGALRSIGFTVVCLLDMKLADMKKAVDLFCELLTEDVYAVFYFAGHGFEVQGKSYLMPVDATGEFSISENYPASEVLAGMAKKNSKLNLLVLDCCRSTPRSYIEDPIPGLCENLPVTQSNIVICFGCCSQGRVLESPACSNGFLAEYICLHIGKNIKVDDVLFEVAKSMYSKRIVDPANDRMQVVYRHSTLVEELSLCDPVSPVYTSSYNNKVEMWSLLHEAPKSPVTVFRNNSVRVDFIFTAEFSNVLLIQSRIFSAANCVVRFLMPSSIGGSKVEILSKEKGGIDDEFTRGEVVRISNLERLSGEVTIHLEVTYNIDNERKREMTFYSVGERPLYAKIDDLKIN